MDQSKKAFVISGFTNPSGEIVFRVAGWLDGRRVRKNFSTSAEATAERQVLEIQRLQTETGMRTAATRLSDIQLQEAEGLFARLAGLPNSLSFYVDFALTNYRTPFGLFLSENENKDVPNCAKDRIGRLMGHPITMDLWPAG